MANKQLSFLFSILLLALSPAATFADEEKADDVERIAVYGKRSLGLVKRELRVQTQTFFDLFNQLNDEKKYRVICQREQIPNSLFRALKCEPRYVKDIRSQFIKTLGTNPASYSLAVEIAAKNKRAEAKAHMAALIETHPELKKEFLKLNELTLEYKKFRPNAG